MGKPNFNVTTDRDNTPQFWLYDDLGPSHLGMISSEDVTGELAKLPNAKKLNVRINSIGGSLQEGLGIYNALKNHPAQVIVDVDGFAASAASIVAMAGDTIRIAANGCMMVHNCSVDSGGTKEELSKKADNLGKLDAAMAQIYADRTGLPLADITAMLDAETWLTAQDCLAKGFADEISEISDKTNAQLSLDRFKNLPRWVAAMFRQPLVSYDGLKTRVAARRRRLSL